MKVSDLISIFQRMCRENWAYKWGKAEEGCVDCSGAFVYAFKQFGQYIYHGSNTIARENIDTLVTIDRAQPGYAAFKRRLDDGEPEKYRNDGWGNFYHIGLVSEDGKFVYNAQSESTGFVKTTITKGWSYACPLKGVDYTVYNDRPQPYNGIVSINSGYLNIRKTPSSNGIVVGKLYKDDKVTVIERENGWGHVVDPVDGWVSETYISLADQATLSAADGASVRVRVDDAAGNTYYLECPFTMKLEAESND